MNGADFLDSNIVLYAYDRKDAHKRTVARDVLLRALQGEFVISTQVLAEVASALLHKVSPALAPEAVMDILDTLCPIPAISPDGDAVRRAVQAHLQYGIHFYDGMIVAAAERAGCGRIWSEDLDAGQKYFGIVVENPFA
jgi:predicted nucleic acid-binding protein